MKQMMKFAAAAGVAGLFAIGVAAPSQAAPSPYMAPASHSESVSHSAYNGYSGAGFGPFGAPGYNAFAYAPAVGHAMSPYSCSTQGPGAVRVDPANCY